MRLNFRPFDAWRLAPLTPSIRETNCVIHWTKIYPVDCVIQLLNNWGEISSAEGYFKKANAFIVSTICFHEDVHHKWFLNKRVRRNENGRERDFVKHWLNSF